MPESKTYILDDLPTDNDALDFMPYVETLVDMCKTANTPSPSACSARGNRENVPDKDVEKGLVWGFESIKAI